MLAPIVIFTYNRFEHFKTTITALKKNHLAYQSEIIIFIDGPRDSADEISVQKIREFASTIDGFKNTQIVARDANLGLAQSIILGINTVFETYENVIVLEDDLVTSPDFLNFMNDCLDVYRDNKKIFSISGFSPHISIPKAYSENVYLSYRPNSWGWATWRNIWNTVDWAVEDFSTFIHNKQSISEFNKSGKDSTIMLLKQMTGKINSWAIRFHFACFMKNGFCIYPVRSKVKNLGTDGSGTHLRKTKKYDIPYDLEDAQYVLNPSVQINEEILNNFSTFFKPSIFRRTLNYFKLKKYYLTQR
jgi:hypothetical protein